MNWRRLTARAGEVLIKSKSLGRFALATATTGPSTKGRKLGAAGSAVVEVICMLDEAAEDVGKQGGDEEFGAKAERGLKWVVGLEGSCV
jgi:hypothetical protein